MPDHAKDFFDRKEESDSSDDGNKENSEHPSNSEIMEMLKSMMHEQKEQRMQVRRIEAIIRGQNNPVGGDIWEGFVESKIRDVPVVKIKREDGSDPSTPGQRLETVDDEEYSDEGLGFDKKNDEDDSYDSEEEVKQTKNKKSSR